MSKAGEADITETLFADPVMNSAALKSKENYINFGKKVATVLYDGQTPYNIPLFFKETIGKMGTQLDSKKIKEILDQITTVYNDKVKEEREKDKKPTKAKPVTKDVKKMTSKYDMQAMGSDEDHFSDGEAGDEDYVPSNPRVGEKDYDFMWGWEWRHDNFWGIYFHN